MLPLKKSELRWDVSLCLSRSPQSFTLLNGEFYPLLASIRSTRIVSQEISSVALFQQGEEFFVLPKHGHNRITGMPRKGLKLFKHSSQRSLCLCGEKEM